MILPMKNKYIYRSRISEAKFREILKFFYLDLEAVKVAQICKISEKTIDKIFKQIRILMLKECENKRSGGEWNETGDLTRKNYHLEK